MNHYRKLIIRSVVGKANRSVGLILIAFILSLVLTFGALLTVGAKRGSQNVVERMGADLIVVPEGCGKDMEGILLTTNSGYFYMDNTIIEKVKGIDGIERYSPQTFLMTIPSSCCDQYVQIVGIDMESDFTVGTWIKKQYQNKLEDGGIIVGNQVGIREDGTFQMFGKYFKVQGILDENGSSMDTTVYVDINQMPKMVKMAKEAGNGLLADVREGSYSAIMVKVKDGENIDVVANNLSQMDGVSVIVADSVVRKLSKELRAASVLASVVIGTMYFVAFFISFIIYSLTINERKNEISVLRIVGMERKKIYYFLMGESVLSSGVGAVFGTLFGVLIFSVGKFLMKEKIDLPFLAPNIWMVVLLSLLSIVLTITTGTLSSLRTARKLSMLEIDGCMREGEN